MPDLTTFVLIHGSSSNPGYWYRVIPLLEEAGYEVTAPDLPTSDDTADFETYASAVVEAVGKRPGVILVAQSMGAFTAPVVAQKMDVAMIVLLAPMIPSPGETPGEWWSNTGQPEAVQTYAEREGFEPSFDLMRTFMHDVPEEVIRELMAAGEPEQSEAIFRVPFPLGAWPDVPTRVIACSEDRMIPASLVRRVAGNRLGIETEEIESGHLAAFGHPEMVAGKLLQYAEELR